MKKKDPVIERHEAIKLLIKNHPVEDQQMLVELIDQEFGIETNQSIVSRDLRQLGISKQKVGDKMIYEMKAIDPKKEILRLAIVDIIHNESLIVIKTFGGLAAFVGDYLDTQKIKDILGTIAGENVLFIAPLSTKKIKQVYKHVCKLVYFKKLKDKNE